MRSTVPQTYEHSPVDYRAGETRLVEVLPGRQYEPIEIRLHNHYLGSQQKYEMLSYVWGSPQVSHPVFCNGKSLEVTPNLHRCLLQHRSQRPCPWLWVDALCINQSDLEEKNHAVRNMRQYYLEAERTICWVGTSLPPSALRLITRLRNLRQKIGVDSPQSGSVLNRSFRRLGKEEVPMQSRLVTDPDPYHSNVKISASILGLFQAEKDIADSEAWQGLNRFLNDSYFHRVWILPDWVYSKSSIFRCGSEEISWDELFAALELCWFYSTDDSLTSSGHVSVVIGGFLRQSLGSMTFPEALLARQAGSFGATNPSDNIYSVMEFASLPGLTIDYTRSAEELYKEAALQLGIMSFSLVDHGPQPPSYGSWVPDWGVARKRFLLNHPKSLFMASLRNGSSISREPRVLCNCTALDVIKATSSYLPPRRHYDHYNVSAGNLIIFDDWIDFVKEQVGAVGSTQDIGTEALLQFAETVQARGCNSIWERKTPQEPAELIKQTLDFLNLVEDENAEATIQIRLFYAACYPSHHRRFGITEQGHFCLVPQSTKRGDMVCIPHGSKVPLVFRREGGGFLNLGESYVHGCMYGEAAFLDSSEELELHVL
ncbi:heterokaryon incompatibility protein-domain-containing protein [Biscogniauxia marginata]|nr:heterokaryon incompatibility protein-domain-containing protein [Biscogniauxia marginata]